MLISFETHSAEFCSWTNQTFEKISFYILHSTAFTVSSFVGWKSIFPPLKIFVNNYHRILKLWPTHRTCHSDMRVLFVSGPNFKAFSMQAFLTNFASRIAFTIHIFVTNRTHWIFFQRRKVIFLIVIFRRSSHSFKTVLFQSLFLLLGIFQLNETF